ncbi:MAG: Gfo/Idh/MocA family oxidoreductase [Candidatus Coatesbacteria bacterium]
MGRPLRALLAGCGGISRAWVNPAKDMPGLEIAGLVDIKREAAEALAEQHGLEGAVIETDLEVALDRVKPDVLFNCTVPEAHLSVSLAAVRRGIHVLCEKPLADSMDHARTLVEAAREAKVVYAVMQNRRYDPNIRKVRALLASGALGRVTTVDVDFFIGAHFGGFRDHMKHVLLVDMAIHTLDQARCLSRTDPVSVIAHEWNPPGSWYDHDASAVACYEMTGGAVLTYRGSWCAEALNTTWEGDWRIGCERGSLRWDGAGAIRASRVSKTGGFHSEWADVEVPDAGEPDKANGHGGCLAEFVRCVREGGVPETEAADNLKSLAMVFGAIAAAGTGRRVPISS